MHWPRTLVQKGRGPLTLAHVRFRPQPAGTRVLHCVLLDMSTSMLKASKLAQAKGYLLALSEHAYRQRDEIAVIGFSGQGAHWVQQPAKANALGAQWIAPLGAGGGTPLHAAMGLLEPLLNQQARQGSVVCTWLLTDGRFVQVPSRPAHLQQCVVVDFDSQYVAVGKCQQLAQHWGADWQSGFGEPLLARK